MFKFFNVKCKKSKTHHVFLMEIFILFITILCKILWGALNIVENKQNSYVYIFNILFFKYIVMVIVQLLDCLKC